MTLHDPAGRRIYGIDNAHAVRLPFILIRCYMAEIDHELEVLLGLDGKNVDITALGRDIRELTPAWASLRMSGTAEIYQKITGPGYVISGRGEGNLVETTGV